MKHALEKHRAFPLIAWATFIAFAVFVFYLTIELQTKAEELSAHTVQNVEALESAP